jgi:hypothetical protein
MRNYPIWFDINSCAYAKNSGAKTGNKSFGVIQHNTQNINVGFGAVNSHYFGSLDISVKEDPENGVKTFQLSFTDGHTGTKTLLKRSLVRQKTRKHEPLIGLEDQFEFVDKQSYEIFKKHF